MQEGSWTLGWDSQTHNLYCVTLWKLFNLTDPLQWLSMKPEGVWLYIKR